MPNAGFFILVKIENRILKKSQLKDKLAEKKKKKRPKKNVYTTVKS